MTYDIQNKRDLTPEKISEAIFGPAANAISALDDIQRIGGMVLKMDVVEAQAPFSMAVTRGEMTPEVALGKLQEVLRENKKEFGLNS